MTLTAGCAALASTSAVLIYLLVTHFPGQSCAWCYLSAGLSFSLAACMVGGLPPQQLRAAAGPGLGTFALALALLGWGFGPLPDSTAQEDFQLAYAPPQVTNASSPESLVLAQRLADAGARMYGAFWCSHCFDQKQTFGKAAMDVFPYVECYPDGWRRGAKVADACEAAGVRAFPTWVINGRVVEGELTLDRLEEELSSPEGQRGSEGVAAGSSPQMKSVPGSPFVEQ